MKVARWAAKKFDSIKFIVPHYLYYFTILGSINIITQKNFTDKNLANESKWQKSSPSSINSGYTIHSIVNAPLPPHFTMSCLFRSVLWCANLTCKLLHRYPFKHWSRFLWIRQYYLSHICHYHSWVHRIDTNLPSHVEYHTTQLNTVFDATDPPTL